MKKVRIFLSTMAVLLAVGATFALQQDVLINGYEFMGTGACSAIQIDCQDSGTHPCTSPLGYDVRKVNDLTTCGASWKKP